MPRIATIELSDEIRRGHVDGEGPVAIRSRVALDPDQERAMRASLDRALAKAMPLILRGTVQLEAAGPRGRVDTRCRIKLALAGRPAVAADERDADPRAAFDRALAQVARVIRKARDEDDLAARRRHRGRGLPRSAPVLRRATERRAIDDPGADAGSVIGRRVGRGAAAWKRALARPEKQRRDVYVDTAAPGVSASDRVAGGGSSARRNSRARPAKNRQVAALEDSRTRPSRKSTRRSATRAKQGTPKERTERGLLYAPSTQTRVARARSRVPKRH
jgi:ribosome-associated translation inhibitor RaiA